MLDIDHLHVEVGGKEILRDINLHIGAGETHVLLGPNGSGKTTLLMAIMGFSGPHVTKGRILFKGKNITTLSLNERARMGMGMMFQRPPTISGLKLGKLLSATSHDAPETLKEFATSIHMDTFLDRDINKGFSGGEIKRSEILQLMVQKPDFLLLDEPESGVDLENMSLMGNAIARLLQKDVHKLHRTNGGLIITHTGYILDYLEADGGHVLCDGEIRCHGNPREILNVVKRSGYRECLVCQQT